MPSYFVNAPKGTKFLPRGTTLHLRQQDARDECQPGQVVYVANCPTRRKMADSIPARHPVEIVKPATCIKSLVSELLRDFDKFNPTAPPKQVRSPTAAPSPFMPPPMTHPHSPYYESTHTTVTGFDYGFKMKHTCPDCAKTEVMKFGSQVAACEAARLIDQQPCLHDTEDTQQELPLEVCHG